MIQSSEGSDLGVLNVVRGDARPESIHQLQDEMEAGQLLVNLRAEADPERLREAVFIALEALRPAVAVEIQQMECFRPGKPQPTYRLALV